MRLVAFCAAVFVFLTGALYAAQGIYVSAGFGAGTSKMTGYNDSINTANAYNSSLGISSKLKNLDSGLCPEISAGYDFDMPAGKLGLYLKNVLILLYDSGSVAKWPNGVIAQSMNSDASSLYTAAGVKVSFSNDILPGFTGYAAADAGLCHYYWNYIAEETYKDDGTALYKIRKEWQTAVPGFSAEAGLEWWFAGNTGLSLKGGYRFASGRVMVKVINIEGWSGALEGADSADYSGYYANIGLAFKFDRPGEDKNNKVKGGQFPGIALWLYKEAETLYEEGLYRQAAQKIREAGDVAPGNPQIEALEDRIKAAQKTENKAESLKKLIKEADTFRDGRDFKKARLRYSEALSLDPENKQAKYYLDEFLVQAAREYGKAQALKSEGKLKEALKAADLAYDYGGSEEARELKDSLRSQLKNKKEQDRMFNEGVEWYQKGDYKRAVELWAEVVTMNPEDSEAAANLEKAKKKLEASTAGAEAEAALKDAKAAYDIGNLEDAVKKCEYVLRLDAKNADALKLLADIKNVQDQNKAEVLNKR